MFDSLTERLNAIFARLRGKGRLTEEEVKAGLREIRLVLLEADVHFKVAKELIERIEKRAVGTEVLESLTPGQQVVKIVRDELVRLLGEERAPLSLVRRPAVVLLAGLQGSGKTTTAAKLGLVLKKEGRKPVLVATDVYRPAAVEQLEKLGRDLEIPVVSPAGRTPVEVARGAVDWARDNLRDVVIIDTAGRLQIDEAMMRELEEMKDATAPEEILLVADAMTGQEAVAIAQAFDQRLALSGIILTKLDGDARGGAALSIRHVTGRPIKFVGMGEKVTELEPFHPSRMADRILGMGDVLSLIEEAEERLDRKKAEELAERIKKDRFTLEDFLDQLLEMRKLGPLAQVLEKLPGGARLKANSPIDEKEIDRTVAILRAMTLEERQNPSIIGGSRKKRIARGSGARVRDVNQTLQSFEEAKKALKYVGTKHWKGHLPPNLFSSAGKG